jgi:DNA-directed RNA polymerase subunit RPC12/RpoP
MFKKICSNCGAIYEIEEQSYPMRDNDNIKCEYCENIIHSWNGGHICSVVKKYPPKNSISQNATSHNKR